MLRERQGQHVRIRGISTDLQALPAIIVERVEFTPEGESDSLST
jgi:hypothetical protein